VGLVLEETASEGEALAASALEPVNEAGYVFHDVGAVVFPGREVDPGGQALMGFGVSLFVAKTRTVVRPERWADDHVRKGDVDLELLVNETGLQDSSFRIRNLDPGY
jgi:hypothetical protein